LETATVRINPNPDPNPIRNVGKYSERLPATSITVFRASNQTKL